MTELQSRRESFQEQRQIFIDARTNYFLQKLEENIAPFQTLRQKLEKRYQKYQELQKLYGQPVEFSEADWKRFYAGLLAQFDFGVTAAARRFNPNSVGNEVKRVRYREIVKDDGDSALAAYDPNNGELLLNTDELEVYAFYALKDNAYKIESPRTKEPVTLDDDLFFAGVEEFAHAAFGAVKGSHRGVAAPPPLPRGAYSEMEIRAGRWWVYFDKLMENPYGASEQMAEDLQVLKSNPNYGEFMRKVAERQHTLYQLKTIPRLVGKLKSFLTSKS